jgi:hypothetical protein
MIAPFALGTQPENADWTDPTVTDFYTGLGIALVALCGLVAFAAAIREDLVARGLVTVRERMRPEPEPEPVAAPQASSSELAALLAPLVEALREDLKTTDRPGEQTGERTGEHVVGRHNGTAPLVGVEENR